ncbi:MAG: hypothetical protein AB1664_09715, partial [Thermodesulfobacteriota bacterium]
MVALRLLILVVRILGFLDSLRLMKVGRGRHGEAVSKDMILPPSRIGVGTAGYPAAPPSEPYVRISRIRLSGRWFTAVRIDRPRHGL